MKRLLLCCIISLVFTRFPQLEKEPGKPLLSLVEELSIHEDSLFVRLTDYQYDLKLPVSNAEEQICLLETAFKKGLPLKFLSEENIITGLQYPSAYESRQYLADFEKYPSLKPDQMLVNELTDLDSCMRDFSNRCRFPVQGSIAFGDYKFGCEFRADFMAKYLEKVKGLYSYKLFLKGDIRSRDRLVKWSYHCANVVAMKIDKIVVVFVLDPLLYKHPIEINRYFAIMKRDHSEIKNQCITLNKFMFVNFSAGLGLKGV